MDLCARNTDMVDTEREKAKATVRIIHYISEDMREMGLGECCQLIRFIADVIRIKYKIQDSEAILADSRLA